MSKRRASYRHKVLLAGNPVGILTTFGKTVKKAEAIGRKVLRSHGGRPASKNIAAGFVDGSGIFHPIRASYDYDSMRTGEAGRKRVYGTKKPITKKAAKARRKKGKKNPKKRKALSFGQRMARLRAAKSRKKKANGKKKKR